MNSLAQTIAAAANTALAGVGTYLRETPTFAGIDTSSGLTAPYIICSDFVIKSVITPVGKEFESTTATIFFGDVRPGAGDDTGAHDATVSRMQGLQYLFFAELLRMDYDTNGRQRTEMHDVYAAMLDGLGMQFTISIPAPSLVPACLPRLFTVPTVTAATFVAP